MTRTFSAVLALVAGVTLVGPARAETTINVSGASIRVEDIDPSAPPELLDIELGRAPSPGSSRLFSRQELRLRLREAGADPSRVDLPKSVRIASPVERWKPAEVAVRADAAVRAAMPVGVTLVRLGASQGVAVPPGTTVASVRPVIPHRVGRHDITVIAELRRDDVVVARTPLSLTVEVGEDAFAPLVKKGDRVTLVVEQGNTRIGASGIAMADANQGDSLFFKVTATGKVLKARLESRDLGKVVGL